MSECHACRPVAQVGRGGRCMRSGVVWGGEGGRGPDRGGRAGFGHSLALRHAAAVVHGARACGQPAGTAVAQQLVQQPLGGPTRMCFACTRRQTCIATSASPTTNTTTTATTLPSYFASLLSSSPSCLTSPPPRHTHGDQQATLTCAAWQGVQSAGALTRRHYPGAAPGGGAPAPREERVGARVPHDQPAQGHAPRVGPEPAGPQAD
eukprot:366097-Chlamydomonas_euryale.AAC.41